MPTISLKAARVNAGLTQAQAAKLAEIDVTTLSRYENDSSEIRQNLLKKLAKLYSMPKDYIFLGKNIDLKQNKE